MRDPLWNEEGLVLLRARIYEYPSQNYVFSHTRFILGSYCFIHLFCFSFFVGYCIGYATVPTCIPHKPPIFHPIIPHTPFIHSLMSFCYASGHHSEDFSLEDIYHSLPNPSLFSPSLSHHCSCRFE